jgi:hypothetical protein
MRSWTPPLAAVLVALGLFAGCGDDDDNPPEVGELTVSLLNLPALPESLYYEAFALFDTSTTAHGETEAVSLGAFLADGAGNLESLDGGEAVFEFVEQRNLSPSRIVVNVRVVADTSLGSPLIAGQVVGDEDEGRATLTAGDHHALNADITTAEGTCVLATPSTFLVDSDENQGVWFVEIVTQPQPGTNPSLVIPELGEGWAYSAWVLQSGEEIPVGTFSLASGPDSDGAGEGAGPDPGFDAPGSDFIVPPTGPRSLNDGETTVIVTIEPVESDHGLRALHLDEPFPVRVLEIAIPFGAASDSSITLSKPGVPLPAGTITFTR